MRQYLRVGGAVLGLALLFVLGWKVPSWLAPGMPPAVVPEGEPEIVGTQGSVATQGGGAVEKPTGAVRITPPRPELAPASQRGRIMDVSKDPAFAGLAATPVTMDLDKADAETAVRALYKAALIPLPPQATTLQGPMSRPGRVAMFLSNKPPTDDPNPTVLIEIPAEHRQVDVPYHFENVPLP